MEIETFASNRVKSLLDTWSAQHEVRSLFRSRDDEPFGNERTVFGGAACARMCRVWARRVPCVEAALSGAISGGTPRAHAMLSSQLVD